MTANLFNISICEVVQVDVYSVRLSPLLEGNYQKGIRRGYIIKRSTVEKLDNVWEDKLITRGTKVQLKKFVVFPMFLYWAETWTIRLKNRHKIHSLKMCYWRSMVNNLWTNISIIKKWKSKKDPCCTIANTPNFLTYYQETTFVGAIGGEVYVCSPATFWTDLIKRWQRVALETLPTERSSELPLRQQSESRGTRRRPTIHFITILRPLWKQCGHSEELLWIWKKCTITLILNNFHLLT